MKKISAVIVAHNEEKKIEDCLKSLDFVDEIVVVLDKCTDSTKEIVLKYTNKIIEGSWKIEGARRNVALQNASFEWILEIDADERISENLKKEILSIKNLDPCLFVIPIDNYINNKLIKYGWLRTIGVTKRQTIAYKNLKVYDEDKEIHPTAKIKGEVRLLTNPINHMVDDNMADFMQRFNRYTNWKSNDLISKNKTKKNLFFLIISFKIRFIKSFILKKGYKEGLFGFILAIFCGLYPLVSYIKVKEKVNENS